MKPSLQLKFSQQLTMTPQLQQAIKLLQLSTLDLQQEIQEALESNPLLEVDESAPSTDENSDSIEEAYSASVQTEQVSSDGTEDALPTSDEVSTTEAMEKNDILFFSPFENVLIIFYIFFELLWCSRNFPK